LPTGNDRRFPKARLHHAIIAGHETRGQARIDDCWLAIRLVAFGEIAHRFMSIRRLRQLLTGLTLILATLVAVVLYQRYQRQEGLRNTAGRITEISQLPQIPEEIDVRHAVIDPSEDRHFVDVILTLTGPQKLLNDWLDEVDEWEKNRPGVIQNHKIREAEMSARMDFIAEIYVKPSS
jgi:hypothetical protein